MAGEIEPKLPDGWNPAAIIAAIGQHPYISGIFFFAIFVLICFWPNGVVVKLIETRSTGRGEKNRISLDREALTHSMSKRARRRERGRSRGR